MITLKLTKDKITALINVVQDIRSSLELERERLRYSLKRAEIFTHLDELRSLRTKLRKKQISLEDQVSNHPSRISISYTQAYLLVLYQNDFSESPNREFYVLTMQQISEPIFKHLLT